MNRFRVLIDPEAEEEIAEAFAYIQTRAPRTARSWLFGLYEAIQRLETLPLAHPPAREADDECHWQQFVYKSHRVIFEVIEDRVHVLHVRHTARDNLTHEP